MRGPIPTSLVGGKEQVRSLPRVAARRLERRPAAFRTVRGDDVAEHVAIASRRRLDGAMQFGRGAPRTALLVRAAKPAPSLSRGLPLGAGRAVFAEATLASRAKSSSKHARAQRLQ